MNRAEKALFPRSYSRAAVDESLWMDRRKRKKIHMDSFGGPVIVCARARKDLSETIFRSRIQQEIVSPGASCLARSRIYGA